MSIDRSGITPSRAAQDRISALSSTNQRLMNEKKLLQGQLSGARRTIWREVAQWVRDTCESEDDGRMCEECDSRAWLIENHAEQFGEAQDPWGERDRARRIAVELEQQLAHVGAELKRLQRSYEGAGYTAEEGIDDCLESYEIATDQVMADVVEDLADGAT